MIKTNKGRSQVFIVSEFVYAEQNSTGYYWAGIIEQLSKDNKSVTVICPKINHSYSKINGVSYEEFNFKSYNKNKLLSRFWGQIKMVFIFVWKIVKLVKGNDIVCSGTNPSVMLPLLAFLKPIKRYKWLLLVHDVYPENLVPMNILRPRSFLYQSASILFNWAYRSADRLIVIGRDMKNLMQHKVRFSNRIVYIPNWVSRYDIELANKKNADFINLGWNGLVIFQFFGNIGRAQGIPNLLEAISLVKHPKAAFLFMGSGAMSHVVEQFLVNHPSIRGIYFGEVPAIKKFEALAACDVSIVSLAEGMNGLGVPSKAYFSLAAGKPILVVTDDNSELMQLVKEYKIGWFCKNNDPEALANCIEQICNEQLSLYEEYCRFVLMSNFTDQISLKKFSDCLIGLERT